MKYYHSDIEIIKNMILKSLEDAKSFKNALPTFLFDVRLLTVIYNNDYYYTLRESKEGKLYFDYRLFNDMLKHLVKMGLDEVTAAAGVINLNNLSAKTINYKQFE